MSGHSKWSTIKHKKGAEDKRRGQLFTKLSRAIIVAAKEGGPDPDSNATLATAIAKARAYSMPKDNIERAIARATGGGEDSDAFEAISYEGYGPEGVAIIVEALTDNRNRTAADVRAIFARAISASARQIRWRGSSSARASSRCPRARCPRTTSSSARPTRAPRTWRGRVDLGGHHGADRPGNGARRARGGGHPDHLGRADHGAQDDRRARRRDGARRLLRLIESLEDLDDVQEVYANFDIPEAVLEAVAG